MMDLDESRHLSKILSMVLDKVGASEYVRRLRQENAITNDILSTACRRIKGDPCALYTFGSFAEGTTVPGLHSDIDTLMCVEYPTVIVDLEDCSDKESFLLVQDDLTPAGYAKLEWVENGNISKHKTRDNSTFDFFGRYVLANNVCFEDMTHDERSGPARTTSAKEGFVDLDYVPAFQCKSWPVQADPWIQKFRNSNQHSVEKIAKFKDYGCFLVPVGQPFSTEKDLQWRLSFSIQERQLMMDLNNTQYKCYICLKLIKNDWIKPTIKAKSLTSYHCKTCLFYMLEVTEKTFWINENLILCVLTCINTLRLWVSNGFIPNYFIPEENMWKKSKDAQIQVVNIFDGLLQNGLEFIFKLRCNDLGELMKEKMCEISDDSETLQNGRYLKKSKRSDYNSNTSVDLQQNKLNADDSCEENETILGNDKDDSVEAGNKEVSEKIEITESEDENMDQAIVDAFLETVSSDDNRETIVKMMNEYFPDCEDIIESLEKSFEIDEDDTLSRCKDQINVDQVADSQSLVPDTGLASCIQYNTRGNTSIADDINEGNTKHEDAKSEISKKAARDLDLAIYKIHNWCIDSILGNGREIIEILRGSDDLETSIIEHQRVIDWFLEQTRASKVYTEVERKRAVDYILPIIQTSLGSHLAAKAFRFTEEETLRQNIWDFSMASMFEGQMSDAQSGKVKNAAVLFIFEKDTECSELLQRIHEAFEDYLSTWGRCFKQTDYINEALCKKISNETLTTAEVLQKSVCCCVTYMPAEIDIVPNDLKYEMFRSVFSIRPRSQKMEDQFDCVHVDSSIYLYYLKYRLYEKQGRRDKQKHALAMMGLILRDDVNLGHPDTANNLFGRILMDMGEIEAAWQCFCDSWSIRPDHNAAKWHMAILLSKLTASVL